MSEVWKAIPGYDCYEASTDGQIRRVVGGLSRPGKPRVLKQFKLKSPKTAAGLVKWYWGVALEGPTGPVNELVHRLVCLTFNGPPPSEDRRWALHRDDDREHNRAGNLYWGTPQDNVTDARKNGKRSATPSEPYAAKRHQLSAEDVRSIYLDPRPHGEIAADYGRNRRTVWEIKNRITWADVTEPLIA